MRARGEGSLGIEKRAGRPWVYFVRHSLPNGKRTARRFPYTEQGKAAAVAHLQKSARVRLAAVMPLGDYLDAWLARKRGTIAPKTASTYEQIIRVWLKPNLGMARLDRLLPSDVETYLHALPLHPQTVSHHRAVLRKALADAHRDGLVERNVASLSGTPTVPNTERKWLDGESMRRLFDSTAQTRHHALWVLAGTTGLRSAELLGLAWSDIDLELGLLRVRHTLHRDVERGEWVLRSTKTKQTRSVPLTEYGVWALRQHRARQQQDALSRSAEWHGALVFMSPTGRPLHGADLSRYLRRDLEAAGLPVVTVHALRHSCASFLLETGTPIQVIASILGHSTPAITSQLYTHVGEGLRREAVDRMQRALER